MRAASLFSQSGTSMVVRPAKQNQNNVVAAQKYVLSQRLCVMTRCDQDMTTQGVGRTFAVDTSYCVTSHNQMELL